MIMISIRLFFHEIKRFRKNLKCAVIEITIIALILLGTVFQICFDRSQGYTVREGYKLWNQDSNLLEEKSYLYEKDYEAYCTEIEQYELYLQKIEQDCSGGSLFEIFHQSSVYEQENRMRTLQAYKKLNGTTPRPYYLLGISKWISSQWQNFFLLLLALLIGIKAFSGDSIETRRYLRTIPAGRDRLHTIRLMAALAELSIIYCISMLLNFLAVLSVTPAKGLSQYIQSVPGYLTCHLNLTVWQFLLLWAVMKWIGMILVLFLAYFLCGFLWQYMEAFICSAMLLYIQFELYKNIDPKAYQAFWHYFNHYNLIAPERILYTYQNINIQGACINSIVLWFGTALFLSCVYYIIGTQGYRYYVPEQSEKNSRYSLKMLFSKKKSEHHTLFYYEGKLFFIIEKAFLILLLFTSILWYTIYTERTFIDLNAFYYNSYADTLQKTEFEEQGTVLEGLEKALGQRYGTVNPMDKGTLFILEIESKALETIRQEYEEISLIREINKTGSFINQITWKKVFGYGQNRTLMFGFAILALVLPVIAGAVYEHRNPLNAVFSYLPGRTKQRICYCQIRCLYGFIVWGLLLAGTMIPVLEKHQIYGWTNSCGSLLFLPDWTKSLPIYVYFGLIQISRLCVCCLIVNSPFFIRFLKNTK